MKTRINLTEKQMKTCRHKKIVINPIISGTYCERCHKDLKSLQYHSFVTKKIIEKRWSKSYNSNVWLWK